MTFTVRIPQLGAQGPAGNQIIEKSNVAPAAEDGAIGDMAVRFDDDGNVFLYPKKTPSGWPAGRSIQGPQGTAGWSPIIATVVGPSSAILRLIDWVGGAGVKPAGAGKYISGAGLVDDPEDAAVFGFSGLAKNTLYDAVASGLTASNVQDAIDRLVVHLPWYAIPLGGYYYADTSIAGVAVPPKSHPDFSFVKLTAGEDGSGEYNEGKLIGESVSGAFPDTIATAIVDVEGSPMYGETIHLLNTEGRILRPSTAAGALQGDMMLTHTHGLVSDLGRVGTTGSLWTYTSGVNNRDYGPSATQDVVGLTGKIGSEVRMKNVGVMTFQKVK